MMRGWVPRFEGVRLHFKVNRAARFSLRVAASSNNRMDGDAVNRARHARRWAAREPVEVGHRALTLEGDDLFHAIQSHSFAIRQ